MTLVALDLNATRLRAVAGPSAQEARPLALEGADPELPLALSLEGRYPEVGRAGVALCRRSPHLTCTNFLPSLGERREWSGPRLRLDASRALAYVFEQVYSRCGKHRAAAAAVPGYLYSEQLALVKRLAEQSRLRLLGTFDTALAATLAAHALQPWSGLALVADVDDHTLTFAGVSAEGGAARLLRIQGQTQLGLLAWKERLLASVADAFIRKSRRDPRDSAEAEQALYDQLDGVLQACAEGFQAEVAVRTPQWYQNLILGAQDLAVACAPLRDRAVAAFTALCSAAASYGTPRAVVVTAAAARLPGLVPALEHFLADLALPEETRQPDDFGEDLLREELTPPHVEVLGAEAVCQATLELADRLARDLLEPGHLEVVPLLEAQPPDLGLPRLHFRGQDHPLRHDAFSLGRDPRCDLVFDTAEFPSVSARHCEIIYDPEGYTLYDSSTYGTLVNNRPVNRQRVLQPGDWIRLGPGGPLLRFLGTGFDKQKLLPTA